MRAYSKCLADGADTGRMLWSVVREGVWMAALGIAAGVVGAAFLARLLSSLLYAIEPTDLVTFLAVGGFLAVVVGIASFVPARRATRIDPVVALRNE